MKLVETYIKSLLHFNEHFHWNSDDDIEIVNIVRTTGKCGFYVKWNAVHHYSGDVCESYDYTYISNRGILHRFDFDTIFMDDRKKKLLLINLKNELNA